MFGHFGEMPKEFRKRTKVIEKDPRKENRPDLDSKVNRESQ